MIWLPRKVDMWPNGESKISQH